MRNFVRCVLPLGILAGVFNSALAFDYSITARVQEREAFFAGADKKLAGVNQFPNGASLRRANIYIDGNLGANTKFSTEFDFNTETGNQGNHLALGYVEWYSANAYLSVGQQFIPMSLSQATSSR